MRIGFNNQSLWARLCKETKKKISYEDLLQFFQVFVLYKWVIWVKTITGVKALIIYKHIYLKQFAAHLKPKIVSMPVFQGRSKLLPDLIHQSQK